MKKKALIASIAAVAVSALSAGSAGAAMIAGWDFSQYITAGVLSTDGATGTDTLDANYSNSISAPGAGPGAAAFGTMYIDGSNGSTDVDETVGVSGGGVPIVAPNAGSLAPNTRHPSQSPGYVNFDSHTVLANEGQTFQNFMALTASEAVSIVFEADLGAAAASDLGWILSFAGATTSGTSTITVDISVNGDDYQRLNEVQVVQTAARYSIIAPFVPFDSVFFRLNLDPNGSNQPLIDNVAIDAVEGLSVPALPVFGPAVLGVLLAAAARRQLRLVSR